MVLEIKEIFKNNPLYKLVKVDQCFYCAFEDDKDLDFTFVDISFKETIVLAFLENTELQRTEIVLVSSNEEKHILRLSKCISNSCGVSIPFVIMEEEILKGNRIIAKNDVKVFFGEQKLIENKTEKMNHGDKDFIYISSADRIDLIKMTDIVFCTADGRYTTIFTSDGKKYVASKNLGEYEKELNNIDFFRIHQSYIVNINFVTRINKKDGIFCEVTNGMSLPVSSRKQPLLYEFLGLKANNINSIGFPGKEILNHTI